VLRTTAGKRGAVVSRGMFGALAAYGTGTRRQLSGLGQFLFMGLIGLVLASIVGIFRHRVARIAAGLIISDWM